MLSAKALIGDVFISYSWKDKPFVRQLTKKLAKSGYSAWVDDHKLLAGDSMAEKISKAIVNSKVILVIISSSSIASKWLRFELNKATEMMIQGKCRVIPVVIENISLPPEVEGILFADFSSSKAKGMKQVLSALQYEVNKSITETSFWRQVEILLKHVFKVTGYTIGNEEYNDTSYESVYLPIPFDNNEDTDIAFEVISNYGDSIRPLNEQWIKEFCEMKCKLPVSFFLLITERPVEFKIDETDSEEKRILIKKYKSYKDCGWNIIIVDMSGIMDKEQREKLLLRSKVFLATKVHEYKALTGT